MLSHLLSDVRYSLRGFARAPMFAVVVVLTLSAAIGVNVAVFSLYDQLMLRQLPVSAPGQLVNFTGSAMEEGRVNRSCGKQSACTDIFSYPMFRDLERWQGPFSGIAASKLTTAHLGLADRTIPGQIVLVSGNYFSVLGLTPALGRLLGPQDDRVDGEAAAVVVSYDYWQTALGADAAALGRTIFVNGKPLEIVGVAPRGFSGTTVGDKVQAFVPITFRWLTQPGSVPNHTDRFNFWLYLFGRLKPGVSLEQAEPQLQAQYRAIRTEVELPAARELDNAVEVERFRSRTLNLVPGARGQSTTPRYARTPLAILLSGTAIVLLIACVNLANLMFARGAARVGEMAVRVSMGAARHRLLGLLATEALLLAAAAAVASLPIALGVLNGIAALVPRNMLGTPDLALHWRTVAVAFAGAGVAALVFTLLPSAKLAATDPGRTLQTSGARSFGDKGLGRFRFVLATSQIALSMLLLVLAALFTQSLANIARVDLGLRSESVLTFRVSPALNGYTPERTKQLYERLERDLAAQPGVTAAASARIALLSGSEWGGSLRVEGYEPDPDAPIGVSFNAVASGFFRTLDIPLLAGRDFTDADSVGRPLVAIVNQSFAQRFGLGDNPIGKRVSRENEGALEIEIVGLIRDAAYQDVKQAFAPQLLMPWRQAPQPFGAMTFYVRTAQAPDALLAAIPRIVAEADPSLPATDVFTLDTQISRNVQTDRLLTALAGLLAAVATLLAALGLYGVLSYTVAQRTREIGLRLALGAEPKRVRGMVLRQVGWMTAIGVPVGLAAALLVGRAAASLLFGLQPADPVALGAAGLLLTAVVLGASYWPARRASRVDPVVALRSE